MVPVKRLVLHPSSIHDSLTNTLTIMPPRQSSKGSQPMKQARLSFTSKRTTSTSAAASKSTKSTRKQPVRASSSPTSGGAIVISDSDSNGSPHEAETAPVPKKRRLATSLRNRKEPFEMKKAEDTTSVTEPEQEREPLNVSDKRWRKLFGVSREKMGNLEPGRSRYLSVAAVRLTTPKSMQANSPWSIISSGYSTCESSCAYTRCDMIMEMSITPSSYEYGPCVGVSRMDRWERAYELGLNPPPEVSSVCVLQLLGCACSLQPSLP